MLVIIKDNVKIIKKVLSEKEPFSYKGLRIYYKNAYYIALSKEYYFEDGTKVKKLMPHKYEIKLEGQFYYLELYVYKEEKGLDDYALYRNEDFILAHNKDANIVSYDPYLDKSYLLYKDQILKSNETILLNGKKYNNEILKNGDEITLLSFSFYYFDEFLYLNQFLNEIKIKPYEVKEFATKYLSLKNNVNYYLPEVYEKEYKLNEIDEFTYQSPKKENIFRQLAPAIVMSLSMSMIAVINYLNALENNQSFLNRLMFLMMPISMIISGVFIPLIISLVDKTKNKKELKNKVKDYLLYLETYEKEECERLENHIGKMKSHFFRLIKAKEMLFYAGKKTDDYLTLSIGFKKIDISFTYKKTDYKEINDKLNKINGHLKDISDEPFFLDLKENKIITLVAKTKAYYLHKILLELCFKHHYDDVKIAVYLSDENIVDGLYNLPHLFYQKRRLLLKNELDLQRIDQLKIDKPLIVILYDDTNFHFSNSNIYLINLTNSFENLYKDSSIIVDYSLNQGVLYKKDKISFKYYEETINYKSYYAYLERFNNLGTDSINYSFRDLFNHERIEEYYLDKPKGLKASFAYTKEDILDFDLHESKHGPHGLIGGSTGSGKSELIVSLLLSLCIRYSPTYLNIILIDYKGGGIKESLSYQNKTIPHIIASLSNLEDGNFERVIIAINNECLKRQKQFKELSKLANVSILNIDDYLANDYLKYGMEAMAHLLIVVDEFAEMKKEHHEYIKELISLSRIGRSLGVHLILATQKPGGVIDDEIWSNSHFKIALKVFEEKDSSDIIKVKDAAYLNNPGEFLIQVDDSITHGQSIYAKKDINDNEPYTVSLLDYSLEEKYKHSKKENKTYSEAMLFVKEIIDATVNLNLKVKKLAYLAPKAKSYQELQNHYSISKDRLIFGEVDDYINNSHSVVSYKLNENMLISTTRRHEIVGIINQFQDNNRDMVIISNSYYQGKNIVASLKYEDEDDLEYLFRILNEINDLELSIIIEDLNCFLAYRDDYQEIIYRLCRKSSSNKVRLLFITYSSNVNFKIINSLSNKLVIKMLDNNDLMNFYASKSRYQGDSFFFNEEVIPFIPISIEKLKNDVTEKRRLIRKIPKMINPEIKNNEYLLGYQKDNRTKVYLKNREKLLITAFNEELLEPYLNYKDNGNIKICVYDNKLAMENYLNILFIGSGIFFQRLFISSLKEDLNEDEGYLLKGNKRYLLRVLNGTILS